jgi:hypothetical protein
MVKIAVSPKNVRRLNRHQGGCRSKRSLSGDLLVDLHEGGNQRPPLLLECPDLRLPLTTSLCPGGTSPRLLVRATYRVGRVAVKVERPKFMWAPTAVTIPLHAP